MAWSSAEARLLQVEPGSGSDAAVVAFLAIVVAVVLVVLVILLVSVRALSDRELPVPSSDDGPGASVGATRFKGGATFTVDGHRYSGSYPFGEIVVDRCVARIRIRMRSAGLEGERIVQRDDVSAVRVSQQLGLPYVEFVDDVRQHGVTRFYGGRMLVEALAHRGWPVFPEP